ncbi:MAG: rod shape-determining protein MreD [Fluviicola sp.]|jgi:rod shape-determining protein MreD|nr:rod shape-determining protein MreD [Fluviicola sp.]MBP6271291.1 rod shape-determining protein MreD [Fluviicola sp.]
MNVIVSNSIRFVLLVLVQVLILNNLEIGFGIYPMLYPLFILLLPIEMATVTLMFISFFFGLTIDAFSNTFGLHASSAVVFAFFRPLIFKLFAPRDGYEMNEMNALNLLSIRWFFVSFIVLLYIHHTWFFIIEVFKWNEFLLILQKISLSVPVSLGLSLIIRTAFMDKSKKER